MKGLTHASHASRKRKKKKKKKNGGRPIRCQPSTYLVVVDATDPVAVSHMAKLVNIAMMDRGERTPVYLVSGPATPQRQKVLQWLATPPRALRHHPLKERVSNVLAEAGMEAIDPDRLDFARPGEVCVVCVDEPVEAELAKALLKRHFPDIRSQGETDVVLLRRTSGNPSQTIWQEVHV